MRGIISLSLSLCLPLFPSLSLSLSLCTEVCSLDRKELALLAAEEHHVVTAERRQDRNG